MITVKQTISQRLNTTVNPWIRVSEAMPTELRVSIGTRILWRIRNRIRLRPSMFV